MMTYWRGISASKQQQRKTRIDYPGLKLFYFAYNCVWQFVDCIYIKAVHHRVTESTEFYFVNCACGVVNNKMLFSVPSVPLW
jgi:hypothetical protein